MARLVVYGSSIPCPDMERLELWLERHAVEGIVMLDIQQDAGAYQKVKGWAGHASVPTLVIAPDGGLDPIDPPLPLEGRRARGFDRGTVLTEPNPAQITEFLRRNGITVEEREPSVSSAGAEVTSKASVRRRQNLLDARLTVVTVYPFTGKQLFFRVPDSWCRECDLTVHAVEDAIGGDQRFELRVKPWWNNLIGALRRGGWHAPVVTIDGKLFSQGIVPDVTRLRTALGLAGGSGST